MRVGDGGWRQGVRALGAAAVVSALLTAFSESVYWYPGGSDYPLRVLVYLIPTVGLLWVFSAFPAGGWPALILAAAAYGFVVEGVLTPVVYGGFPFDPFAISYTSLGWHALVSVAFGLVLTQRLLARSSSWAALGGFALFGAFWGAWAMSLRLPPDADEELPTLGALNGQVGPGTFVLYATVVTLAIGLCHLLLGRVVTPRDLVPPRWLVFLALVCGALWFALLVVPAAPWAPVELAVLLWVCRWGLRRLRPAVDGSGEVRPAVDLRLRLPVRRLLRLATIPVAAGATYALLVHLSPSERLVRALYRDSVVVAQTLAGWAFLIWALRSAYVRRGSVAVA